MVNFLYRQSLDSGRTIYLVQSSQSKKRRSFEDSRLRQHMAGIFSLTYLLLTPQYIEASSDFCTHFTKKVQHPSQGTALYRSLSNEIKPYANTAMIAPKIGPTTGTKAYFQSESPLFAIGKNA